MWMSRKCAYCSCFCVYTASRQVNGFKYSNQILLCQLSGPISLLASLYLPAILAFFFILLQLTWPWKHWVHIQALTPHCVPWTCLHKSPNVCVCVWYRKQRHHLFLLNLLSYGIKKDKNILWSWYLIKPNQLLTEKSQNCLFAPANTSDSYLSRGYLTDVTGTLSF